jgi:ATP-dependent protease ClpP protease subunit
LSRAVSRFGSAISRKSSRRVRTFNTAPTNFSRPGLADVRSRVTKHTGNGTWYRIDNKASASSDVYIYDEIGYWGVTAQDFVDDLKSVKSKAITVHINSPGGEVWDGLAIYDALKNHPADVTVRITALAASAASFIAMAGDKVIIGNNAQMMIHDAMAVAVGNPSDMRSMAELLDRQSDNIADIYARRAGGTADEWRTRMSANGADGTWYFGQEAVDIGLADEVTDPEPTESAAEATQTDRWELSIFTRKVEDVPDDVPEGGSELSAEVPEVEPIETEPDTEESVLPENQNFGIDPIEFRTAVDRVAHPEAHWTLDPQLIHTVINNVANSASAPPVVESRIKPTPHPVAFDTREFELLLWEAMQ